MTKEETNLLTLTKYYVIYSDFTNRIYLDRKYQCYIFSSNLEAKQFCDQLPGTHFKSNPCYIKPRPFISMCYGTGVEQIMVKSVMNDSYVNIPVRKDDAGCQFYNREAERNILRLKQTHQKKYLLKLAEQYFLSPIMIDERENGQYPVIHYSYAMLAEEKIYYLLFTTIQEFEQWNSTQSASFCPNQTSFHDLNKIRGNYPVLINPLSDLLVLTNKQILSIT